MKAIFGVLSLLIVLAVIASIAKKQLFGVGTGVASREAIAASQAAQAADPGRRGAGYGVLPGATVADPNATVPQLSRDMQQRAVDNTTRALQQGVERSQRAER